MLGATTIKHLTVFHIIQFALIKFTGTKNQENVCIMQRLCAMFYVGRHVCECQAHRHPLINNCTCCGRVVCDQEGSGPCLFCGQLVSTHIHPQCIQHNLFNQLVQNLKDSYLYKCILESQQIVLDNIFGITFLHLRVVCQHISC